MFLSVFAFALTDAQAQSGPDVQQDVRAKAVSEMRQMVQRIEELQGRLKTLEGELSSPTPPRPVDQIQKEHQTVVKELGDEYMRLQGAQNRHELAAVREVKGHSLVMTGTATATAVLKRLYPQFLRTVTPQDAKALPAELYFEPRGSDGGVRKLIQKETEVAVLDRPLKEAEREALGQAFPFRGGQTNEAWFCKAALTVVVHPSNRVKSLTISQLEDIFRAEINKWSAVGGPGRSIDRLGTKYPCLSWEMFTHYVLRGQQVRFPDEPPLVEHNSSVRREDVEKWYKQARERFPGRGPFPRYPDDGKVMREVARNAGAIGYCLLFPSNEKPAGVRLVPIGTKPGSEGIAPTRVHVLLDKYPLQNTLWFLVRLDASQAAKRFVDFACSSEAAETIEQCGLYPVVEREKMLLARRVADMLAGKGAPIRMCGLAGGEGLARDLAAEYVKAEAVVQATYRKHGSLADAVREFLDQGELLVWESGEPPESGKPKAESGTQAAELGTRAVGVVVHPDNGAKELTMEDLRQIYRGEIDEWPETEGAAGRILICGLPSSSPAMRIVDEMLLGGGGAKGDADGPHPRPLSRERERGGDAAQPSSPAPRPSSPNARHARVRRREDTAKVILSVGKQPGAVGFVDLAQVSPHETAVKLVAIVPPGAKGAEVPTAEKVPEGYPLAKPVMLYLSPKASETAKGFFEFVAEGNAREALKAHGIIPNPNPPKFAKDDTLAAVKEHFEESKPEKPEGKSDAAPEELATVVPDVPVAAEEEKKEKEVEESPSASPSGEAASGREKASAARKTSKVVPEDSSSGGSDARYFLWGAVGLMAFGLAVIGLSTIATKRRRERLGRCRR